MVQTERETGALRGQFARQAAVQASAAAQAESARAQAEQLSRKLAAARAEVRRYQTRMFAFERTLLALKHDNAELEAACEQAWEQLEQANARAEKAEAACRRAEAALAAMQQTAPETPAQPDTAPEAVPQCEAAPEQPAPETEESLCAPEQALPPEPAQPAWQPETRLEQMAAERGNRIFTGRAVTTNGLLSNNVCKGYCKNWIAFIQPGMKTFAENTGKWQKMLHAALHFAVKSSKV